MNNMMMSIGKHFVNNYAALGLADPKDIKTIENPKDVLVDGGKWLTLKTLRTLPDSRRRVPFYSLIASGQRAERYQTLLELELKTRAPDPSLDFFWNTARDFRDKVTDFLAGPSRGGLIIPRYDYTDQLAPQAGEIWFEIDDQRGYPLEDPVEDPDDPANKSIFLTYLVSWWKPV